MDKTNNNKILFISPWYPSDYDTMIGLFIKRHIICLKPFISPCVIHIKPIDFGLKRIIECELIIDDEIPVIQCFYKNRISAFSFINSLIKPFIYLISLNKAWKLYKRNYGYPNLVHINILTRSGLIALYLKLLKNIPYIISEHWSRYYKHNLAYKGILRKLLTQYIVKQSSAILVVSEELKNAMQGFNLKNNYSIIPNAIDTELFKISIEEKSNKTIFTHISCFEDKSKNISAIIDAAEKLYSIRKDFELHLIGDGIDYERMQALAKEKKIKDNAVFFHGVLEGDALVRMINKSDVGILFSQYETFGIVTLEFLSCGVPVISSRTGVFNEIYNKDFGFLVDIGNEEQLYENMLLLMDKKTSYNREKLRSFVEENYSYNKVAKAIINVYQQAGIKI